MILVTILLLVLCLSSVAGLFVWRKRGFKPAALLFAFCTMAVGVFWWLSNGAIFPSPSGNISTPKTSVEPSFATSSACVECHREQYDTWYKSFHRTMTRDATPEYVKGNFDQAKHNYQGIESKMTREGDAFFMETADPLWAMKQAETPGGLGGKITPTMVKLRVDRVVGSHWLQECLHQKPNGEFMRLPLLYHLAENRWVHSNGSFLAPDSEDFWSQSRGAVWNETCLFCHNTGTQKNPVKNPKGLVIGYKTTVHELGISCEACHGPGGEHVAKQKAMNGKAQNRLDVVNPEGLSVARRDDICARCHGALVPKSQMWDPKTHRDPFIPGLDLSTFNHIFWSEREQAQMVSGKIPKAHQVPEPTDGRFWGDGTPLTTALEFNGMALSPCYQQGKGTLSCLSCHTMHGDNPNFMLKTGMNTNEACFQCHEGYRDKLEQHTRHGKASAGSQCQSCHMPKQVYSLMGSHLSHRIQIPDLKGSLNTGKPHACNLCHLDKSLGWTQKELAKWPNGKSHSTGWLSPEESSIASSVLTLTQGDARSRAIVSAAFIQPSARLASGEDWFGVFLPRLMRPERYGAVRYLTHKALKSVYGEDQIAWDPLARPEKQAQQLQMLLRRFDAKPVSSLRPYLPLTPEGLPDEAVLKKLLKTRKDPDLTVNE